MIGVLQDVSSLKDRKLEKSQTVLIGYFITLPQGENVVKLRFQILHLLLVLLVHRSVLPLLDLRCPGIHV